VGDIKLQFKSEFARFEDLETHIPLPGEKSSDMGGRFVAEKLSPEEMANAQNQLSSEDESPFAGLSADNPPF
jgi:hypothetical protein